MKPAFLKQYIFWKITIPHRYAYSNTIMHWT